jgi:hypothetical protein
VRKPTEIPGGISIALDRSNRVKDAWPSRKSVAHDVLSYLLKHPRSEDTLEGILEWWLLEQRMIRARTAVRLAVRQLLARKFLLARRGVDGRVCYRLNPAKLPELKARRKPGI